MLNELLLITREIENTLGAQDTEKLSALLDRRREIFAGFDPEAVAPEDVVLLREVRECEESCLALAGAQAEQAREGLLAARRQRRLESAYGGGR